MEGRGARGEGNERAGGGLERHVVPPIPQSRQVEEHEGNHAPDLLKTVPMWGFGLVRELCGSVGEVSVPMSLVLWGFSGAGVHPSGALGTGRETSDLL